ncbi:uncharacterized protein K02A2.6-like [Daphnia carinata]|uniref:uncharacterized protein K02A2.6-like n=1 Tax=Daphnia carinata TaxID=120202 RepID=UPI0025808F76|nr:uncharacterized protein K02A2.6-like [Daphnia carinata]
MGDALLEQIRDILRGNRSGPTFGRISEFDSSKVSWSVYEERMDQYFSANKITEEEDKKAVFITVIGDDTYTLLRDLLSPDLPSTKTFDELRTKLREHLSPKPLVIAERFRFNNRVQKSDESASQFLAALRHLSRTCEFGPFLDDALRDRFVCGLQNESTKQKLISTDRLTSATALTTAVADESVRKDVSELRLPDSSVTPGVNRLQQQRSEASGGWEYEAERQDDRKKPNKSALKKSTKFRQHQVEVDSSDEEDDDRPIFPIHTMLVEEAEAEPPVQLKVLLDGVPVDMEVDNGAAVSVVSKSTWIHCGKPSLEAVEFKLRAFRSSLTILGAWRPIVSVRGEKMKLPIVVVKEEGPSLCGRNWIRKICPTILSINHQLLEQPSISWIERFPNVFKKGNGTIKGFEAVLELKPGAVPKFFKARPVPYAIMPQIEAELLRMEREGVIEKVNFSQWASPIVVVPKPSGDVRICGDYKPTLNPQLKVDIYPLPTPQDLFAKLSGGKVFTKLDLSKAYQQLRLAVESRDLVTINTHKGLFRPLVFPYGVASGPAIFQLLMDTLLQGIEGVYVFLDDILVSGKDDEEHDSRLEEVFKRLNDASVVLEQTKCLIKKKSLTFLGFILDGDGIKPTAAKVEAVKEVARPEDAQQVRTFLGLVNFYVKFVPRLATIAAPLYDLLKKESKFQWTEAEETSFQKIKTMLCSKPALVHYDPKKPIRVYCDASAVGVGAALNHVYPDGSEKPVAYSSKKLSSTEQHYAQIEREALALVIGVTKFHQYLFGRSFELVTDHKPLLGILSNYKPSSPIAVSRIQRWFLALANYSYTLVFRPTDQMGNADSLSRAPIGRPCIDECSREFAILTATSIAKMNLDAKLVKSKTQCDPILKEVLLFAHRGWPEDVPDTWKPFLAKRDEIGVSNGVLLWGGRVIVPQAIRSSVLDLLHEGHSGVCRMKSVARSTVWWPGLDSEIEKRAKECEKCAKFKENPPAVPVHRWIWPAKPWSRIHIDFAGPFIGKMFFIVVDAHSKWPEVGVLNIGQTTTAAVIAVLRNIFARHGLPDEIVSDNGTQFTSNDFEIFLQGLGVSHILTPPYHPSSNGEAERFVRELKIKLKILETTPSTIDENLSTFLSTYRTTPHTTTGISPAELLYGRRIVTQLDKLRPAVDKKFSRQLPPQSAEETRNFLAGSPVWLRMYNNPLLKWVKGVVTKVLSPVSYLVRPEDGVETKRHVDQLMARAEATLAEIPSDQQPSQSTSVERYHPPLPLLVSPQYLPKQLESDHQPERGQDEVGDNTESFPSHPAVAEEIPVARQPLSSGAAGHPVAEPSVIRTSSRPNKGYSSGRFHYKQLGVPSP